MLLSYTSIMLSAFFLLTLSQVLSRVLEKPLSSINKTMIIDDFGISHKNLTTNNPPDTKDNITSRRAIKRPTLFIKSGFNPVHKINSYTLKGIDKNSIFQRMPWNKDPRIGNKTGFKDMLISKQSSPHRKYPNHSTVYRSISSNQDKRGFSSNELDYDQSQDYDSEYYSDGHYNTISGEQEGYNKNHPNIENSAREPWRVSYSLPNVGYFLPPFADKDRPVAPVSEECNCPTESTRSYDCQNPSGSLLNLLSALGQNIWGLLRFIVAGTVPLLLPFIILKLIIIPLKILKIISMIKFFFKFFVVLPIFLRIILPALFNFFSSPGFLLQNILGTPLTYSDPRQAYSPNLNRLSDISNDENTTSTLTVLKSENLFTNADTWGLKDCPKRISCEMGALLATTTGDSYVLEKIGLYLSKMEDTNFNGDKNNYDKGSGSDKKEDKVRRDEAFKIFLTALSKKWTKDKCKIYNCSILL